MIKEICVIGHPSYFGGADTEILDQIKCWHKMGIKIYICHTGLITKQYLDMNLEKKYGCIYLKPRQWNEVKDMHCISYCNGEFLKNLHFIKKYARSATFVNCMTWNFQKEIECQSKGLIDFHLYQTQHAFEKISTNLKHLNSYRPVFIKPHFDHLYFPYHKNRKNDHFRFGKISRCDLQKFHPDQMKIYDSIDSPVLKSGVILGYAKRLDNKLGIKKTDIEKISHLNREEIFYKKYIQLIEEGGILQQQFYDFCDVLISAAQTFENLPRIGFESMASGSILVVDNRGGWKLQVDHGVTGYLCDSTEDFIKYSSFLAHNKELKEEIRWNAYNKLEREWGLEESMKSWYMFFKKLEEFKCG